MRIKALVSILFCGVSFAWAELSKAEGGEVTKDEVEAVKWYQIAADKGDQNAQLALGNIYLKIIKNHDDELNKIDREDRRIAIALGNKLIMETDTQAWFPNENEMLGDRVIQREIGEMYACGYGVEKNPLKASKWIKRAADQGDRVAQNELGELYSLGFGVSKDENRSQYWHKKAEETLCKAARKGDPTAQLLLGRIYSIGIGGRKDQEEAKKWNAMAMENLHQQATQGDVEAKAKLGFLYSSIITSKIDGFTKNDDDALKWTTMAAVQGDHGAQWLLSQMYKQGKGVSPDESEARKWSQLSSAEDKKYSLQKAALNGNEGAEAIIALEGYWLNDLQVIVQHSPNGLKSLCKADDFCHQTNWSQSNSIGAQASDDQTNATEAIKWYRKAADQGNRDAQTALGEIYSSGLGVAKDEAEAEKWRELVKEGTKRDIQKIRIAAEKGDSNALYEVAKIHEFGFGVTKDEVEAVQWYQKAAEQGNLNAQKSLSKMYEQGRGASKNEAQSTKLKQMIIDSLHKAAGEGNRDAQKELGFAYDNGRGVPKDKLEAAKWYRIANEQLAKLAENGDPSAQVEIGFNYERGGRGVSKDIAEAVKWYRKVLISSPVQDPNAVRAQARLGHIYASGLATPTNEEEFKKMIQVAADQNSEIAQMVLGDMYSRGKALPQNGKEAEKWYRKSVKIFESKAKNGDPTAMFYLGKIYFEGKMAGKNDFESTFWYNKAAESGNSEAEYVMGDVCAEGRGIPKDLVQAYKWYSIAASNGDTNAPAKRDQVKAQLTPEQILSLDEDITVFIKGLSHKKNLPLPK